MGFFCVYILQSQKFPDRFYTGITDNLRDRLRRHNAGEVPPRAKYHPRRVKTAVAFTDEQPAREFEC